mmetsp:Transcript_32889/g.102578  ORF Transcript_32889/g.102578 Transcript_32889/m.102578 type:complete len:246 (+) Transcript_32889:40-777(+)
MAHRCIPASLPGPLLRVCQHAADLALHGQFLSAQVQRQHTSGAEAAQPGRGHLHIHPQLPPQELRGQRPGHPPEALPRHHRLRTLRGWWGVALRGGAAGLGPGALRHSWQHRHGRCCSVRLNPLPAASPPQEHGPRQHTDSPPLRLKRTRPCTQTLLERPAQAPQRQPCRIPPLQDARDLEEPPPALHLKAASAARHCWPWRGCRAHSSRKPGGGTGRLGGLLRAVRRCCGRRACGRSARILRRF